MSRGRTTYGKRQREQEKRTKAKEKAQRRAERQTTQSEAAPQQLVTASEGQLIDQLAAAHRAFEDGALDHDEFEERRSDIGRQLEQVRRGA